LAAPAYSCAFLTIKESGPGVHLANARAARGSTLTAASVIHDTFTIERSYPAAPSRVFAAFASAEAKSAWGDTGNLEPADGPAGTAEFDFRPGGRERFGMTMEGTIYRYDACYYDIVPDQRIIYASEMYASDARISVSVATIEFAENSEGAALTWTEQGAYLDGIDGPQASASREEGTAEMLDGLARFLATRIAL
jgi:uncharacterized protein YndB with AHSA1/START domain